jgi:hypothetical protein
MKTKTSSETISYYEITCDCSQCAYNHDKAVDDFTSIEEATEAGWVLLKNGYWLGPDCDEDTEWLEKRKRKRVLIPHRKTVLLEETLKKEQTLYNKLEILLRGENVIVTTDRYRIHFQVHCKAGFDKFYLHTKALCVNLLRHNKEYELDHTYGEWFLVTDEQIKEAIIENLNEFLEDASLYSEKNNEILKALYSHPDYVRFEQKVKDLFEELNK